MTKPIRLRTTLSATTILAAGLMLAAAPARAQSLPDTGNVTSVTSGLSGGAPGSTSPTFAKNGWADGPQILRVDLRDNRTILNWGGSGFDIAAGNTVDFKDARATSGVTGRTDNIAVLNRDLSGSASNIYGNLRSDANVAVYVTNTAGIIFGESSVTNTGALFASSLDLTDANFLNTPTSLQFSGSTRGGVTLKPGARITTVDNGSSDGGRMGDLVLIGNTIMGNEAGTARTLSAGGDLALVAASGVTVQNAPGSPLSFVITAAGRDFMPTTIVSLVGNMTGKNVTVATLKETGGNAGQAIELRGDIAATGAAITDRGVVLTAGLDAPGVQLAATGVFSGNGTQFLGNVASAKDIVVRDNGSFININGAWTAPGKIDIGARGMNGNASTITGGQLVLPTGLNIAGKVKATNGDLTFGGPINPASGVRFNGGVEVSGSVLAVSTVSSFDAQSIVAGGIVHITTGQVSVGHVDAPGSITIESGFSAWTGNLTSNGNIRVTAAGSEIIAGNVAAGGSAYLFGYSKLKALDVYGKNGVTLITQGNPDSGQFDAGRLRIGNVSTGAGADIYIKGLQLLNATDGRVGSLVAGRNIEIEVPVIDAMSIKGLTGNVQLTATGSVRVTGAARVDELFAGNAINVASTGTLQLANVTAQTGDTTLTGGGVILGSTTALSNVLVGGNLTITSPGAVQLRASVTAGGDLNATGNTVMAGNGPISGGQIRAKGAINLTATTSSIQSSGNVLIQSNSDGVGDEALTLSAATGITFLAGSLQGGTDRQSDVRIRSAMNSTVAVTDLSARSLLSATGTDPFTNGITRNAAIGFFGQVNLINGLSAQGTSISTSGRLAVSTGNIDLRASNAASIGGALNAPGDISVTTGTGNLTIGANGSFTGSNILLSTPGAFINNGGASIMAGAGRWLVYSADPAGNAFGGLDSGNTAIWNATLATRNPSTITGNRYVFAYQPTLTFSTVDFSKVYGIDLTGSNTIPFAVSGLHPGVAGAFLGDTAATAYSGSPLIQSAGFAERASVAGGPYSQTIAQGSLLGNLGYAIAIAPSTGLVTVTPKSLTATVVADNKTYDGTTAATGSVALNGVLAGDNVGTGGITFTFADKNAGTGKTVAVGGTLTGADSGNYTLTLPASALADILQKALTASVTANSKTYDGSTAATGALTLNGVVAGDTVGTAGSTFTFADKNAGTGKTVAITGTALIGTDSGNYTLTVPASALADILKKALTATTTANGKVYDGTTVATGSVSLNGVVAGDTVGTTGSVFSFADKNAGTGKAVNVTGTTLTGADSGNYTLTLPAGTLADILQKALTASVSANGKTYDGTTATTGSVALNGVVAGDDVGTGGVTFTFTDKNAGAGKAVAVGGGLSGTDAANYAVSLPASVLADILKKAITANAAVDAKTYDGSTTATGALTLNGVVAGDTVGTAGTSFTFADKNAGTGKTVAITGSTLTGADSGNYTLTVPASALADILKKAITASAAVDGKTYDGSTTASGTLTLNGVVAGDMVGTSGTSFAFADKNAGTGKAVNVTGTTLTGADSGNYTLTVPASALADILKKSLTATVSANGKTYDGTTVATGSVALNGVVSGDAVSTGGVTFTFADKNAGTGKAVAVGGDLSGADAGNYTVSLPASVLADILKKSLTATVSANGKTYDGTTATTGSVSLNGVVSGDAVSTGSVTFTFADKNAGTGKVVAVGGGLSGADAGNYTVSLPASVLADILKKSLTATVSANGKTYDGTTAATGSVALNGVVAGDTVGTTGTAFAFADKNAGTGKAVNLTGTTLTGTDSGNYTLTIPGTVLADIAKRALSVNADDKAKYTGEVDPALTYTISLGSLVAGDQLSGALARTAGEGPGDYAIGQGSLSAGNNYTLTFTPGTLTISVNPATSQTQTLRAVPLPSGIQAPPTANAGVSIDANVLCAEDKSCVAN